MPLQTPLKINLTDTFPPPQVSIMDLWPGMNSTSLLNQWEKSGISASRKCLWCLLKWNFWSPNYLIDILARYIINTNPHLVKYEVCFAHTVILSVFHYVEGIYCQRVFGKQWMEESDIGRQLVCLVDLKSTQYRPYQGIDQNQRNRWQQAANKYSGREGTYYIKAMFVFYR